MSESELLFKYERSVSSQVAALSEFQVGRVLAEDSEHSRYIIWSPEGGNNDFGILVDSEYPNGLEGDGTSKFMQLVSSNIRPDSIVPLDIKSFMAVAIYGSASWILHLSLQQMKTCQAVIIVSPKEPDFVILLPVQYLRQRKDAGQGKETIFNFTGDRILWKLHPLPAFPSQLTPFVLPFSGLGQAVADMRDYHTGVATSW